MPEAAAVKLTTPPGGLATVPVGSAGKAGAGPRTDEASGALHTGVMSAVVGAATLPATWWVGPLARAVPSNAPVPVTRAVRATMAVTTIDRGRTSERRVPAQPTTSHRRSGGVL